MSENEESLGTSNEQEQSNQTFNQTPGQQPSHSRRPRVSTGRPSYGNRPYGENRPYNSPRPYNQDGENGGEYRPRNYDNRPRPYNRPEYRPNNYGEQREQSQYGDRPRPYNQNREGGYAPRYNSYGNDAPRPRYDNRQSDGERPRYDRPQYDRPQYQNRRSYPPRTNYDGQQSSYGDRPRGEYRQYDAPYRPYNRPDNRPDNRQGGYSRPYSPRPQYNRTPGYNPNAIYSNKKQIEYKETHIDPEAPIRLNKYLANSGLCSRREADTYIQSGAVSVNGVVVTELGTKVKRSDAVLFNEKPINIERKTYILLNKPKNCVTTVEDPQDRVTVMQIIKGACAERVYPVGRLDRNTTGVLLLTNDGEMSLKLTHPSYDKKKVYQVKTDNVVSREDLDKIATGITLDDGTVIKADGIGYSSDEDRRCIGIEIHSGQNRVVRRIFETLGYKILTLDRVLFAGLTKKGLKRGDWRFLTEAEVNMLRLGAYD